MSDGVETRNSLVRPRTTEHTRCEERAIQTAVLPDEVVSELPRDLRKCWFSRLEYLSRNGIGVGDDSSLGREDARHR